MPAPEVIGVEGAAKDYALGRATVHALRDVSFTVQRGEFTSVAGPSGSGKTTLLNLIGCLDQPTAGRVRIDGQDTSALNDGQLTELRLSKLGFIFQSFNLIAVLTAHQNVEFPLLLQRRHTRKERDQRVKRILEEVGLQQRAKHRPSELSGGERQRVAIARALVTQPAVVLADEPTANLDSDTGLQIIALMQRLNRQYDTTFVFSTHDARVLRAASRVIWLQDGAIADAPPFGLASLAAARATANAS
jgi:putative ABC transport system ATP-binding protein